MNDREGTACPSQSSETNQRRARSLCSDPTACPRMSRRLRCSMRSASRLSTAYCSAAQPAQRSAQKQCVATDSTVALRVARCGVAPSHVQRREFRHSSSWGALRRQCEFRSSFGTVRPRFVRDACELRWKLVRFRHSSSARMRLRISAISLFMKIRLCCDARIM